MATPEQLQAIREELRNELRAELRNEAVATAAQVPDAIKRKPEIPPFDKKQIDNWIRRTENAFIRALCDTPREKFAFLETKFPVDFNPRINEFLWGEATQTKWDEFIAYLRAEYGTTKQQQATVILDGLKRDGRKPSQYAALLDEKTKDITLDDIKKEMLVREMPTEVQRMLQERIDGLSFKDAAKAADAYFDQDGKPRHIGKPTSINAIQETYSPPINATRNTDHEFTSQNLEEDNNINAIGRRFQNQRSNNSRGNLQPSDRSQASRGWHARTAEPQKGWHAQTANTRKGWHAQTAQNTNTAQPTSKPSNSRLCFYHDLHGNRTKRCEASCPLFDEKRFLGNGRAGK